MDRFVFRETTSPFEEDQSNQPMLMANEDEIFHQTDDEEIHHSSDSDVYPHLLLRITPLDGVKQIAERSQPRVKVKAGIAKYQ